MEHGRNKRTNERKGEQTTANWKNELMIMSEYIQLVLFSRESRCFPRRSRGKHQDSRENKTNWFPEGPDIKCFVIFLDFHSNVLQQQQKNTLKRSESKQYDSVLIRTQISFPKPLNEWFTKYFHYIICIFFLH